MRKLAIFLAAASAFSATPALASTNILVNGSFESPVVDNSCCTTTPSDSLPGWSVNFGDVNVVAGTFGSAAADLAKDKDQYLDLIGQSGSGSISQTINTVFGQVYQLSFYYSHNIFSGTPSASASVNIGTIADVLFHSTGNNTNLDWQLYSGTFTGTGEPMALTFSNLTGGQNEGILLDAVSITATPEPAAWLMMILGFGLVGGAIRGRRKGVAFA